MQQDILHLTTRRLRAFLSLCGVTNSSQESIESHIQSIAQCVYESRLGAGLQGVPDCLKDQEESRQSESMFSATNKRGHTAGQADRPRRKKPKRNVSRKAIKPMKATGLGQTKNTRKKIISEEIGGAETNDAEANSTPMGAEGTGEADGEAGSDVAGQQAMPASEYSRIASHTRSPLTKTDSLMAKHARMAQDEETQGMKGTPAAGVRIIDLTLASALKKSSERQMPSGKKSSTQKRQLKDIAIDSSTGQNNCSSSSDESTIGDTCRRKQAPLLQDDPLMDLQNLWSLCFRLRGCFRSLETEMQGTRAKQIRAMLENGEKLIQDDRANKNLHILQWRCMAIEVAVMYTAQQLRLDELKAAWLLKRGKLPHQRRDLTLDWLTGQFFDKVDIYELKTNEPRRRKVEHWLRIGCPLQALKRQCGFMALIVPGMRISQEAFTASRTGDFDTPLIRHLVDKLGDFKEQLACASATMEAWVINKQEPALQLRIEAMEESDLQAITSFDLRYWTQIANPHS